MYALDAIKTYIVRSGNGNVTITKTVANAVASLGRVRKVFTAGDVTYVINRNVFADEQITEKQVTAAINAMVAAAKRGERYIGCKFVYSIGYGFYQYGK